MCQRKHSVYLNAKLEQGFQKLGTSIASRPLVYLCITFIAIAALSLGWLAGQERVNGIEELWVEKGSRIHGENDFVKEVFPHDENRVQYSLATSKSGENVITEENLEDLLALSKHITENIKVEKDGKTYGWEEVCFRPTASASLGPLADAADIYGMPCFRYHVLDCFQEGDFDYNFDDIDAANVGVTVAAVGLPNTYLSKPSFRGKTPQQLLDVISPTCQSWSGLPIPENYVVGGISRAGADTDGDGEADGALTGVISTQSVWRLFSATTFAKREKERNCAVAGRETCTNSFKSCAQQCVAEGGLCGQNCVGAQGSSCVTAAVMAQGATCVSDLISAQVSTCLQSASTPGEQMDCQIAAQKCGEFASDSTTFAANQNDCTAATLQSLGACSDDANLCGQFFSDSTANAQHQTKCTAATLTTGSTCVADATKCGGFLTTGDTSLASFCTADTLTCVGTCQSSGETCVNNCVGTAAVCKGTAVATSGCDLTVDDEDVAAAEVLLESWEQKFLEYLETVDADNFDTRMFAQRSRNDLVKEGGEGSAPLLILGYAAMCLFAIVALFQTNFLQSKVGLALSGLLLVCLSTVASYGCAAMFDIPLTPTNTIVAPFLALGLGVNDMFVIVYSFQYSEKKSLEQMLIDTVVTAGPSISLTSLCIFVAFACGTSVLLPAVHYFCLFSMIIVVLNYLVLLFGFVPLLYYTGLRIRSRKLDVLCCLPYTSPAPQGEEQAAPTDVEMKAAAGEQKSDNTADVESGSEKKSRGGEGDGEEYPAPLLDTFRAFAELILSPAGMIVVGILAITVFIVSVVGLTGLEYGLPLSDIVPENHYAADFLYDRELYFHSYSTYFVLGKDSDNNHVQLDYANDLDAIVAAEYEMDKSLYTYEAIGVTDYSILDKTIRYVNAEYPGSDKLDCNRKYAPNTALCMLAPAKFYESFTEYLATSAGLIYGDQIAWTDASKSEIKALKIPFVLYNARSYDDKMDALRETRYATDSNKALGAYPQGSFYTFYEQFVNVEKYMVQSLLMCAAVVTIVCFGFLFHPMAVLLVVLSIGVTVVEVLGFLSLAGLKANGPSAMNMILAVGLCIEFNVHLARHFITASGTRRERAVVAVTEMGGPVFLGGISTFLGVCFLSGAEFPYFVLYFFNMYAIIIFIGMMNGLLLLPVLLSLVGPDAILDNAEGAAAKDNEEEEANKNQA